MSRRPNWEKKNGTQPAKSPATWELYWNLTIRALGLPQPTPEVRFAKAIGREWRFDYAFEPYKVAVEIEGGIWVNGAHTRAEHYQSDMEKYNNAQILGWIVLRFTPEQIIKGQASETLKRGMKARGWIDPDPSPLETLLTAPDPVEPLSAMDRDSFAAQSTRQGKARRRAGGQ